MNDDLNATNFNSSKENDERLDLEFQLRNIKLAYYS
jgi:hypothetical protein